MRLGFAAFKPCIQTLSNNKALFFFRPMMEHISAYLPVLSLPDRNLFVVHHGDLRHVLG